MGRCCENSWPHKKIFDRVSWTCFPNWYHWARCRDTLSFSFELCHSISLLDSQNLKCGITSAPGHAQRKMPGHERQTGARSIFIFSWFLLAKNVGSRCESSIKFNKIFNQVEMMLSEDGLRDDERARGFNSKIVVSYDVRLVEGDAFTWIIIWTHS